MRTGLRLSSHLARLLDLLSPLQVLECQMIQCIPEPQFFLTLTCQEEEPILYIPAPLALTQKPDVQKVQTRGTLICNSHRLRVKACHLS